MSETAVVNETDSEERTVAPQEFLAIVNDLLPELYELHETENGPAKN